VLPRLFREEHLRELDKTEEEELGALERQESGAELDDEDGDLELEMHQFRVVHHLRRHED
jgi:hypothetical protein